MILHDFVADRSLRVSSPYDGTTNIDVDNNPYYNDTLTLKRDYRLRKAVRRSREGPGELNPDEERIPPNGPEDGYQSKADRFVERNREVIESGAMFHMQSISKPSLKRCNFFGNVMCHRQLSSILRTYVSAAAFCCKYLSHCYLISNIW